jgi:hypothetical protein
MKRVTLVAVFLLFVAAIATAAEDAPKVELFAGYSLFHCNPGIDATCNLNGWDASATFKVNNTLGIVADFGGTYGTVKFQDTMFHTFAFGPKISYRTAKVTPFAQALFGLSQAKMTPQGANGSNYAASDNFEMAIGGGLDVNAGKMAIRVAQAEFITTPAGGAAYNHFKYSAGFVFKLGK